MAITVRCSSCRQQFQVRDNLAGKSIVCRECGAEFQARAASAGDHAGDDPSDVDEGDSRGPKEYATARPSRKSRTTQAEPVLTRRRAEDAASNAGARRASGGQRALWIYLGAGGVLLLVVVLIINSVGSSPQPPVDATKVAPPSSNVAPPPVTRRTDEQTRETASTRKSPGTKQSQHETTAAAENEKSVAGETGREEHELTMGHGSTAWQVVIDRPAVPFEFDDKKKISATMPKNSSGGVVFPDCPSPFVALGSNNTPREIREVRDLQGNRRIGSVKNATIVNAWVALSPDGQYFAAWPAGQNQIGVWAVKAEKPRGTIRVAGVAVPRLMTFAGNNRLVAIGGGDDLFTWHIPSGNFERSFVIPKINAGVVAGLSPGGRYLAIAVPDFKKPFVRVVDLAGGIVAGEITLGGFEKTAPTCHALAFSPDGAELAALYETPTESHVLIIGAADGNLALDVRIEECLRTRLRAADWQGGHGLEWYPNKQAWLVYGQAVVERASGEVVWTLPPDDSGGIRVGHLISNGRLLLLGVEKQDMALPVIEIPPQ
jgi:hypothetical protein